MHSFDACCQKEYIFALIYGTLIYLSSIHGIFLKLKVKLNFLTSFQIRSGSNSSEWQYFSSYLLKIHSWPQNIILTVNSFDFVEISLCLRDFKISIRFFGILQKFCTIIKSRFQKNFTPVESSTRENVLVYKTEKENLTQFVPKIVRIFPCFDFFFS